KHVVFSQFPANSLATLYLLTMQSGALQVAIKPNDASSGGVVEIARTWLDNSHVLLSGMVPNSDAGPQDVFLLDIGTANQNPSTVPVIYANDTSCWGFDTSFDSTKLYLARCTPGTPNGSSTITAQPIHSSTATTILNTSTESFSTIRII